MHNVSAVSKQQDFNNIILLNKSKALSTFPTHFHQEAESIYCVKGSFTELLTNRTFHEGEHIHIASLQRHAIHCTEDSLLMIVIEQ